MTPRTALTGVAAACATALLVPTAALGQLDPGGMSITCGVPGLAAKAGVDTATYVGRVGMSQPAWLGGETLVVERFPAGKGAAGGTLAFVMERTTFAPPDSITRLDTGKDALASYQAAPGVGNVTPGRTLVVPGIGPLCPQSVTPGPNGVTFTATVMGLQDAFLAGRFSPLRRVPAPPEDAKAQNAREHAVPSTVRVIERRNASGRTVAYVDVGANLSISGADLDFGWSRTRGYWGTAGFTTTFRSVVTAAITGQGVNLSDSTSVSGIIAAGAFGPIPFTVRLGATVSGRLRAPGAARLSSTRTKVLPLKVRCQTRRMSSGRYCGKTSGSGRAASGVSWSIRYDTGGDVILRGSITPTVSMLIADMAGPYAGVTGGAEQVVDVTSSGRFVSSNGKAWITARAGGELRFLGWVKRFGFSIWSRTWRY